MPADPEGRVDWLDFRDDLIALAQALELERAVLAGHSMGATVSLLAAAALPGLARRLVLIEPVIFVPGAEAVDGAARSPLVQGALRRRAVFADRQAALDAYLGRGGFATWPAEMVADYVAGGFKVLETGEVALACEPKWEAAIFAFQAHDSWQALTQCPGPVDIWRAERDSTFRVGEREAELAASPRIRIETVGGTSHFLPMEAPDRIRAALTEAIGA